MSTESLKRTPEKIETLLINEGVLKHTSVKPNIPKRPCINALKRRLHDSKKKDQLKNCKTWFDGCNHCFVQDGQIAGCTKMYCLKQGEAECLVTKEGH